MDTASLNQPIKDFYQSLLSVKANDWGNFSYHYYLKSNEPPLSSKKTKYYWLSIIILGWFYVAGNSKFMPSQVREALVESLQLRLVLDKGRKI